MKSNLSSIFALVLIETLVVSVKGLDCYSCVHVDGLSDNALEAINFNGLKGHSSCKNGSIPSDSVSRTCGKSDGIEPICASLYGEGKLNGEGVVWKITVRGCFHPNPAAEELPISENKTCSDRTLDNLRSIAVGQMRGVIERGIEFGVDPSTSGQFCYCDADKCNMDWVIRGDGILMALACGLVMIMRTSW